ncbi:MAG: hypothetical protein ACLUPL_08145 [Butyricimonas virosa]
MNGKGNAEANFCITPNQYDIYLNELYGRAPDGSGTDNRLRAWFQRPSSGADYYNFRNFTKLRIPARYICPTIRRWLS